MRIQSDTALASKPTPTLSGRISDIQAVSRTLHMGIIIDSLLAEVSLDALCEEDLEYVTEMDSPDLS